MQFALKPSSLSAALALCAGVLYSDLASAQAQSRQLVLNEPVRRQLVTGDRHAYSIRLDAGQFLFATVDHRGIDVYVSILDSSGEVVTTGEGPTGANGLEYVSFVPETSGWYWIAVLPRVRGPEVRSLHYNSGASRVHGDRLRTAYRSDFCRLGSTWFTRSRGGGGPER